MLWVACGASIMLAVIGIMYLVVRQAREDADRAEATEATAHLASTMRDMERDADEAGQRTRAQLWGNERPSSPPKKARILYPLPAGYRCIGHDMFKQLPNGWSQMNSTTAYYYCL